MNTKHGKDFKIFYKIYVFWVQLFFSILENMLKSFNQNGTTYYHPILDNYPQYETLKVQENVVKELDSIQSYQFSSSIEDGKKDQIVYNVCV